MFKAVLSGTLDDNKSISDVQGSCFAEACKWDEYTTLAVCAAVEDISSSVEIRKDSAKLHQSRIRGASWEPPAQSTTNVPDTFWSSAPFNDSSQVRNGNLPPISNIYTAYFPPCNKQKQSWGNDDQWTVERDTASNWKAYKATLSLCLQTLSSAFNSTMETKIMETRKDLKWKSSDAGKICLAEPYKGDIFCVGEQDIQQWSSSLQRTLDGAAMLQVGADNYYTGQWVPNLVADIIGPSPAKCDPTVSSGYDLEGFTRRINNLAISMSNALRTGNTTSPDSFVPGSEWTSEQYIVVDFKWLSLPAAIYFAITFFLLMTIFKSRKGDIPLWKSSPQVLLHVMERNNGLQTLKQVDKGAKNTQVQLVYTGENWHLQDVTGRHT